jgi:kynureninase
MTENNEDRLAVARALDSADPLAGFREQFHIPRGRDGTPVLYLVGNSLGLQPKRTASYVLAELEKWQQLGVRGHFEGEHPWMPYHEFLAGNMASLVGALPQEVVTMNSLTTNLHLMLASFFRRTPGRHAIAIEYHAFPSDHHAVESQIRWHGGTPEQSLVTLRPQYGEHIITIDDVVQLLDDHGDELAVLLLPGVQYYTGQVFPIAEITRLAHERGIIAGFDLAHAAGNIELRLHEWNVDFAVWCTYKYLNSGPGSVGGCFIHQRHAENVELLRLAGWWGHEKETRFQMDNEFRAIPTAEGWQLSNPPILSLAAVRASLDLFAEAGGMGPLLDKSRRLTTFFREQLARNLESRVNVLTPARSGCQLSLQIADNLVSGKWVHEQLKQANVEVDWREPNVIRAAPVPLYNSFEDICQFVEILKRLLDEAG